jgi:hypothetical protein
MCQDAVRATVPISTAVVSLRNILLLSDHPTETRAAFRTALKSARVVGSVQVFLIATELGFSIAN